MKLGEPKKFAEPDWKRRLAYALLGEIHVPGWLRLKHAIREIDRLYPPEQHIRVLDGGCGRAELITYLAERRPHWTFVGIDANPKRLEIAEQIRQRMGLSNVSFQVGDLCNLPFCDEFDLAISLDVLEHIEDDHAAVGSLSKALKPGGYLLLTSPSVPQPKHLPTVAWRERRNGLDPLGVFDHVRQGYTLDGIAQVARDAGSVPKHCRYTYGRAGTLSFDLFFSIGDSAPNPILFTLLYPVIKLLAWADLIGEPEHGAAVLAVCQKSPVAKNQPEREGAVSCGYAR